MSTLTSNYYDIVSQLPAAPVVIFRNVGWEEYEDLLEQVGEASHLRISYAAFSLTRSRACAATANFRRSSPSTNGCKHSRELPA